MDHWRELYHGKRSAEILEALIDELKTGGDKGPEEFEGQGVGEDIPKFD